MQAPRSVPQPVASAQSEQRQCVFCLEEIRPGASVCPHCGSNLAPLQGLADRQATLEGRVAGLEVELAALRTTATETPPASDPAVPALPEPAVLPLQTEIGWPHMVDNLVLGLAALLAAHWLATMLPGSSRTIFRLAGLMVALPFGLRFQRYSRSGIAVRVLAALVFGAFGTLINGVLDIALAGHSQPFPTIRDIIASVAAITLSHFAGSSLASMHQQRTDRASKAAARIGAATTGGGATGMHIEAARIKSTADTVKALTDAMMPLAAGAAALWAALGHILS
jgi:hypothetical protein